MQRDDGSTGSPGARVVDAAWGTAGRTRPLLDPPLDRRGRPSDACRTMRANAPLALALVMACAVGCGRSEPTYRTRAELLDPQTCKECHAKHYEEWAASMHAYASRDPVFLAMNRRGQEETAGALGSFCVNCHAPMAVREGATVDGMNLSEVPEALQGVGCYFCHNVAAVEGTHNGALQLANDVTLRGRITDPVANPAHRSENSALLSGAEPESASMCGACHDIVLPSPPAPAPVALERTFQEWSSAVFAPAQAPVASAVATCTSCHMPPTGAPEPIAEGPGLKVVPRNRHSHHFAGVDVALDAFPSSDDPARDEASRAEQRKQIQQLLDITLRIDVCVQIVGTGSAVQVTLDNANAGHNWPSGASQDRRAFVEVIAYREGARIYESGVVADGQQVTSLADPDLWLFRDRIFDAAGEETHMFWKAARFEAGTIGAQVTSDPGDPRFYTSSHVVRRFPRERATTIPGVPDRVTVRVRIRPMGLEVLDDLIASGHLAAGFRDAIPTFDLLPNRALAAPTRPQFAPLAEVSMEWSQATRSSGIFYARQDFTELPVKDCVGMPRRP